MAGTIVVGVDGSPGSAEAFRSAVELARHGGVTIQPVMAWEYPALAILPFPAGLPVPPVEAMQADAEVRAVGLVDALLPDDGQDLDVPVADPIVRQGSPGRVVCDAADGDDLIVVGSRGLGGVRGLLLGSVSAHCVSAAPCPVLVVPGEREGEPSDVVVVGVDGSDGSDAAVAWADEWAPDEVTLLLVHAWDLPVTIDTLAAAYDVEAIEAAADVLLEKAAAGVSRHGVETLRTRGDARYELARLAADARMLVVGSQAKSVLERFVLGSVASYTVHHLVAPTVVVHPPATAAET